MTTRILVTGDRNWSNYKAIKDKLSNYPKGTVLLHGAAKGADFLASLIGEELKFVVIPIYAEWETYGRAAGPIRNKKMLALEPNIVYAFHDNLEESKGTKHCVTEARKLGIPVEVTTDADSNP